VKKYLALAQIDVDKAHKRASPVDNWSIGISNLLLSYPSKTFSYGNHPVKSYQREVEKSWQNRARRDPHEEVKVFRKSDRQHLEGSGSRRGAGRTCSSARV
jgi:hypothetical protein